MTDGPTRPRGYAPPSMSFSRPHASWRRTAGLVLWLLVALAVPLSPRVASATLNRALTFEQKIDVSKVILQAEVERVESEWEIPDATIITWITVRVVETLKGGFEVGQRVRIRQGGGKMGDLVQVAEGMSTYEPGEEAVLFLDPLGAELIEVGIGIAKYAVESNGREKRVTFNPDVGEVRIDDQTGEMVIEPVQPMTPISLPAFLRRIRDHVGRRSIEGGPYELPMLRKYP